MTNLYSYQKEALKFALKKKRCMLCLDMGLGKTVIALSLIKQLQQPALVLAPKNVAINTWGAEIEKHFGTELSYRVCAGDKFNRIYEQPFADVTIVNHDRVRYLNDHKLFENFKVVIIDESTYYGNTGSDRTKILIKNLVNYDYVVLMTGTPIYNDLFNLYSQMRIVDLGERLGNTKTKFRYNFYNVFKSFNGGVLSVNYIETDDTKIKVIEAVKDVALSMSKEDFISLPYLNEHKVELKFSTELLKSYHKLKKDSCINLNGEMISTRNVIIKLQQFVGGFIYDEDKHIHKVHNLKIEKVKELTIKDNWLIACNFKAEAQLLSEALPNAVVFNGDNGIVKNWNDGNIKYLICNPKSASTGLNLQQGGCNIIWYSLTWSLSEYLQFNSRLHRNGQEKDVNVYKIIIKNTIDELINKALFNKGGLLKLFLNEVKYEKV